MLNKFKVSEDMSDALSVQQTQLIVTTVMSGLGLLFITIANVVTEIDGPKELEAPREDESA